MYTRVNRTELTPLSFLLRTAYIFPEKTAIIHGDRSYTYSQLAERVHRLASALRKSGLQKEERVAILSPNSPALLEVHFAIPAAGGILLTINTRLSSQEIAFILEHAGVKWLLVDEELFPLVESLDLRGITLVRIADTGEADDPYEQFLATGQAAPVESWLENEEATISINYTSGTTGNPKGVMYSHRATYLTAAAQVMEMGLNSDTTFLWTLPMFHCNGWTYPWAITAAGGTHLCLRKFDPGLVWELLEKHRVTQYNGAPTVSLMLVNHPAAKPLSHPVHAVMGGAPPSPTLMTQMKAFNLHPTHTYGLTETCGPYAFCEWHSEWNAEPMEKQAELMSRQGQGNILTEMMRVVDADMQDVPKDGQTIGEVVMRGNLVMKGYYENEAATKQAFRGGWFHSGDLGVWHPDGYVELRDRAKDIIISGGENISTIELQQMIVKHPAVLECAVIGIPDEKWGERPKAFVHVREGHTVSEQEIIDFCRARMAHFKCPDAVSFGPLPKTSTGKVQKYVLREQEWKGKEKRIN